MIMDKRKAYLRECFFSKSYLPIFLIMLGCWSVYFNSLDVPFYLDDIGSIVKNQYFDDATYVTLFYDYGLRYLGYMGFWINFEYFGLDVLPYHIVNVFIHMLAGVSIFFLTKELAKSMRVSSDEKYLNTMACLVALLFVLHPLQSQGVTYIVQRLTSQVAVFYIASLLFYLRARSTSTLGPKLSFLFFSVLFAVGAFFTKQNSFTLPLAILLCEWLVFSSLTKKKVFFFIGVCLFGLISLVLFQSGVEHVFNELDGRLRETNQLSRIEYFLPQLPIVWTYIGKLFLPWPLQLEYDYHVDSFSAWIIFVSGVAHLLVIFGAILLRAKYPLFTWGILFYYLAHAVESSIIPISDFAFEHRTYLPNVGFFVAFGSVLFNIILKFSNRNLRSKLITISVTVSLLVSLSILTFMRNQQWLSPELLLSNDLKQAPKSARAIHNYAEFKLKEGDVDVALELLESLMELELNRIDANMFNTYLATLINSKQYRKAIDKGSLLLEQPLRVELRALIHANLGTAYVNLKDYEKANMFFEQASVQASLPINSLIAYAYASLAVGEYSRVRILCNRILDLEPQNRKANILLLALEKI